MPVIIATYKGSDYEGVNYEARPAEGWDAEADIKKASPWFASFLKGLAKVPGSDGKARSAFSCAEAHALSKVLAAAGKAVDWTAIRFPIATASEGLELCVLGMLNPRDATTSVLTDEVPE